MTIGFDQTAVTVLEGEIISLSTSIKNSELTIGDYLRTDFFEISTLRGRGNAIGIAGLEHCLIIIFVLLLRREVQDCHQVSQDVLHP